LNKKDLF